MFQYSTNHPTHANVVTWSSWKSRIDFIAWLQECRENDVTRFTEKGDEHILIEGVTQEEALALVGVNMHHAFLAHLKEMNQLLQKSLNLFDKVTKHVS